MDFTCKPRRRRFEFSEQRHLQTERECESEIVALLQVIGSEVALGNDGFLHLDERITPGDPLNCRERTGAVVAGADEHRIGQGRDLPFHRVEGAVEEILHAAGHVTEVLRGAEQQAVGPQQVAGSRIRAQESPHIDAGYILMTGTLMNGVGHPLGAVRLRVVDDQQVFHGLSILRPWNFQTFRRPGSGSRARSSARPARRPRTLSAITGANVFLKFENHQFTASFKERGALNCLLMLTGKERRRGVIAMSAGNHAQALAYHGARLGIPVCIVMPRSTPNVKVQQTRVFGAEVHLEGSTFEGDAGLYGSNGGGA